MNPILFLAAAAAASAPDATAGKDAEQTEEILVTASREPVEAKSMVESVSAVRSEAGRGEALGLPMLADLARTAPGVSVATSGPKGSQTQIRIRGAEANHTLLLVDGIRFNDPAAGNEARFELLSMDGFSYAELSRGAQSALWGSEAIGGVIAVHSGSAPDPGYRIQGTAEYGALDSARLFSQAAATLDRVELVASAGWLRSEGIDSFDGKGDRDGFDNRSGSVKLIYRPDDDYRTVREIGLVGHWIEGESEYDGLDPVTFRRADTLDETSNRIGALRGWIHAEQGPWLLKLDGSFLASSNINRLAGTPLNRTSGRRFTTQAQLTREADGHRVTVAAEFQGEDFRARDQAFFGATDQDRSRDVYSALAEWNAEWRPWLTTNVVLRHDSFSAFGDSTTVRAAVTVKPTRSWALLATYGDGIAQPSFYDLYGFFPNSFTGNPALRPEQSREWQARLEWKRGSRLTLAVAGFAARLRDEIIDVFDPATFRSTTANTNGVSRRRGLEAEVEIRLSQAAKFSAYYSFVDAEEQQAAGALAIREVRRPRHSFALNAHGEAGRLTWGATMTYVGKRRDTDFDVFPARSVILDDYALAAFRVAWRLSKRIEGHVRAENAFDADYQDVVGYRTPGRTVYAGLRFSLGD